MIINRLKDILRSSINHELETNDLYKRLFEEEDDFEKTFKEYEASHQKYEQHSQQQSYQQTANSQGTKEAGYYADLELPVGASFEQIKKSYRRLMKVYHPDRFHNEPEKHKVAVEISGKLNEAYEYFEKKFGK